MEFELNYVFGDPQARLTITTHEGTIFKVWVTECDLWDLQEAIEKVLPDMKASR